MVLIKPFIIQDLMKTRRVGVAVKSLEELTKKGCLKLKIKASSLQGVVRFVDGTEVDEEAYFQSLEPHTVLVFLKNGEKFAGCIEDTFNALLNVNHIKSLQRQIQRLLKGGDQCHQKLHLVTEFAASLKMDIKSNTRTEHPDWFEGLDKRFKTKEDYLKSGAQGRIRGYLKAGKAVVSEQKSKPVKAKLGKVFEDFQLELKHKDYHGDMFVRSLPSALCDGEGWFACEGPYDEDACPLCHLINPYGSKEARIVFSTWNLDHVIEKSRDVLPNLVEAVQTCVKSKKRLNRDYFYDLLFTKENLKLVHIACHKKEEHKTAHADKLLFFL